MVNLIFI